MKRLALLFVFLTTFLGRTPLSAADECPPLGESIAPNFTYESPDGNPNLEPLVPQITDYLNAGGAADALPEFFASIPSDEDTLFVAMNGKMFTVNMDTDTSDELLISIAIVHTGFWGGGILLYDCVSGTYNLMGQAKVEGWTYGDWGFNVFEVADHTQNGQPEIYIQRNDSTRGSGYEALAWNGEDFTHLEWFTVITDEPLPNIFASGMGFSDQNKDGIIEASLYFHYDARETDHAYYDLYQIRDEAFHYLCPIYLGDEAFLGGPGYDFLIEKVEEADSYFRCGFDDVAEPLFRQVLDDDSLEEVDTGNFGELFERENLRAFSLYRLVLLNARRGDDAAASDAYAQLQEQFPVEVPGSNYTSMAEAFWLEYEPSADWDAACAALAAHIEPTINTILEDDMRWTNALYLSTVAGYPGHRPNALIRDCSSEPEIE